MSELTHEEFQERLSTGFNGEILYTANDGETYQIGTYEMELDWYAKDYSGQIAEAYLLDCLYQGTPIYSEDEDVFAVSDMKSYDLQNSIEEFLDTYFIETDVDFNIYVISDNPSIDLNAYDLPEDVIEELEHFSDDDMVESFRDAELLRDDYAYFDKEARENYAEIVGDVVKSKMNIRYQNGGYPLSSQDIDYSKIDNLDVFFDVIGESSQYDSHRKLFLTGKEDLLLDNIREFSEESLTENFEIEAILDLCENRNLKNDREFFLAHTQSNYGPNTSLLVRFASEELKADRDFAIQWLEASKNMKTLQCFSDDIRNNLDVLKHAIEHNDTSWLNSPNSLIEEVASKELAEEFKKFKSEIKGYVQDSAAIDFINSKIAERFANKLDGELSQKSSKADRLLSSINEDAEAPTQKSKTTRQKI